MGLLVGTPYIYLQLHLSGLPGALHTGHPVPFLVRLLTDVSQTCSLPQLHVHTHVMTLCEDAASLDASTSA